MKTYIVGNLDGNTDVIFEEQEAVRAYMKNLEDDNGAWVQVWENNKKVWDDPIYKKI